MFKKKELLQNNINKKIMAANNDERKALVKSRKEYTPLLFNDLQQDKVCQELFPCCMYLLELSFMFPLSVPCIERLFMKMKLIKTRWRNQFSDIIRFSFAYQYRKSNKI